MVKSEVKNKLIDKIKDIDDPKIIHEIYRLLEIDLEEDLYITTDAQKEAVNTGLSQIKKGEVFSEEEANKQSEEWLNEDG